MKIETGYKPGIIGDIVEMHARYYNEKSGFGATFEAKVASGLADFVPRLAKPCNQIWHISRGGKISASITIDGEDLKENTAHLRWFIVNDALRGTGAGNQLIQRAANFCDAGHFDKCVLWTFKGLDAAKRLYEKNRFDLVEEWEGNQWGTIVTEQRYERISQGSG
ncbi:MAG: GNAT family N-acetyltransferase [Rhizobiaceae bacterium]